MAPSVTSLDDVRRLMAALPGPDQAAAKLLVGGLDLAAEGGRDLLDPAPEFGVEDAAEDTREGEGEHEPSPEGGSGPVGCPSGKHAALPRAVGHGLREAPPPPGEM